MPKGNIIIRGNICIISFAAIYMLSTIYAECSLTRNKRFVPKLLFTINTINIKKTYEYELSKYISHRYTHKNQFYRCAIIPLSSTNERTY